MSSPDKPAEIARLGQDAAHVVEAESLVDVETHLRELDGDIDLGAAGREAVEHAEVLISGRDRVGVAGDALAEEVEGGA